LKSFTESDIEKNRRFPEVLILVDFKAFIINRSEKCGKFMLGFT